MELRVGNGFDIHRRGGSDRPLFLGGIRFPGEAGLLGHSDADVVLHAVMDALLGAAALGDIGHHFPPEDSRFKDADSAELTRKVARRIARAGFAVVNLDITSPVRVTSKNAGSRDSTRAKTASRISATSTLAPSLANRSAISRPMPEAAPVTIAVRPLSRSKCSLHIPAQTSSVLYDRKL